MTATIIPTSGAVGQILSRLDGVKPNGSGLSWTARCPSHDDHHSSLSITIGDDGRTLVRCFVGCTAENIVTAMGLQLKDLFRPREMRKMSVAMRPTIPVTVKAISAAKGITEDFLREQGVTDTPEGVLIEYRLTDRTPASRQRLRTALSAKDGSFWLPGEGSPVPYGLDRLPDAREQEFLILVEGESDCWTLWMRGFPALGIPGAAMTGKIEADYLAGIAEVYYWREPDTGGNTFAKNIPAHLRKIGFTGQIKEMKIEGVKDPNALYIADPGGFDGAFNNALNNAALVELIDAPVAGAKAGEIPLVGIESPGTGEFGPIYTSGDLPTATAAAWEAVKRVNAPPTMFRYGGAPVRLGADDTGRPTFEVLTVDRMRHVIARAAPWKSRHLDKKTGKWTERDVSPPIEVVKDMLATASSDMPLPVVAGIVEVPTFAADGTLCNRPGYNPENRTYYAPPPGLAIPDIPLNPTEEDVRRARVLLMEPIAEMRFAGDADMAHTLALGILPYVRDLVGPCTPIHLFDAPIHGSGKTKTATVALIPAMGEIMFVTQADDDEFRKRITSQAIAGRPIFFLDNITRVLNSAVLSSAITAQTWTDRVLGKSVEVSIPNRMIWVVTGNNVALSGELARRSVRIRIDPETDQPWTRTGFRIPNLEGWVAEHRAKLVAAALILVRAWVNDGMTPFTGAPLGSMESWSRVMGGILERGGIGGFLENLTELYEDADIENNIWRQFVIAWWNQHQDSRVGTKELFPIAVEIEGIDLGKTGPGTEKAQRTSLGKQLQKKKDVVSANYKISASGKKDGAQLWRLTPAKKARI